MRRFHLAPGSPKTSWMACLSTRCRDHLSTGRGPNFSRAIGRLNAMASHSGFSDHCNSLQPHVAARCLSLVDAGLDEMIGAPEETSEGSLRLLLRQAIEYETQLTSQHAGAFQSETCCYPRKRSLARFPI